MAHDYTIGANTKKRLERLRISAQGISRYYGPAVEISRLSLSLRDDQRQIKITNKSKSPTLSFGYGRSPLDNPRSVCYENRVSQIHFHPVFRFLRVSLALAICAACSPLWAYPAAREAGQALGQFDFRQVVKEAKEKVFPTVVFIKCVRENLEAGQKQAQEVAGSGVIISS